MWWGGFTSPEKGRLEADAHGGTAGFLDGVIPFKITSWDFPGGPVGKTTCFQFRGYGFNSWSGN